MFEDSNRGRSVPAAVLAIALFLGIACGTAAATAAGSPPVAEPAKVQPSREFKIGAYYFGYWTTDFPAEQLAQFERSYGRKNDWWAGVRDLYDPVAAGSEKLYEGDFSHLKPLIGFYDLADQATIESHIAQAKAAGLDYFNFYWYWDDTKKGEKFVGTALSRFLTAKNRDDIEFMISITSSPRPDKATGIPEASYRSVAEYLVDRYLRLGNYLKSPDGRPMIQIFDDRGIGDGGKKSTDSFLEVLSDVTRRRLGVEPYLIGMAKNQNRSQHFDAYTCSEHFYFPEGADTIEKPYERYLDSIGPYYQAMARNLPKGKPVLHCASSGRDERPRSYLSPRIKTESARQELTKMRAHYTNRSPALFAQALRKNRELMEASPDPMSRFLVIYAWNEWNEGGIIEPNVKDGTAYLRAIGEVFAKAPEPRVFCDSRPDLRCDEPTSMWGTARAAEGGCGVFGWAADRDRPDQPVELRVFVGTRAEPAGREVALARTNRFRFDVNAIAGLVGDHGFSLDERDLASLSGGRVHELYVYAVNLPGTPGKNRLLNSEAIRYSCR